MSLINDMLKDLDTQKIHRNPENDAALLGLGLAGNTGADTRKRPAFVIAVSLLVLLAVFAWSYTTDLFARNSKPFTIENTTRDILKQLSSSQPAVQKAAARPQPARAPRTENTRTGSKQHKAISKPAAQVVEQVSASTGIVTHPLSVLERVQRNYQKAVHALRIGKHARAEQLLDQALALDSSHHKSRLLLASLYIRQQKSIDAESLLASGLAQNPGHSPYAKLYAQLLVAQARYMEAIKHLQTALPGAGQDAEYYAILAGLFQRTDKPSEAAQHYRQALRLTPERGEWWMGLGISQEQAGIPEKAIAAYQRALHHPLSSPLQQYVNTRIKHLSRQYNQG